jgi:hypothetical protein
LTYRRYVFDNYDYLIWVFRQFSCKPPASLSVEIFLDSRYIAFARKRVRQIVVTSVLRFGCRSRAVHHRNSVSASRRSMARITGSHRISARASPTWRVAAREVDRAAAAHVRDGHLAACLKSVLRSCTSHQYAEVLLCSARWDARRVVRRTVGLRDLEIVGIKCRHKCWLNRRGL